MICRLRGAEPIGSAPAFGYRRNRARIYSGQMKNDSEQPEFLIGAFLPIGLGIAAVVCAIIMLTMPLGPWRVVMFILTILLVSAASAILGAIWVSRRQRH